MADEDVLNGTEQTTPEPQESLRSTIEKAVENARTAVPDAPQADEAPETPRADRARDESGRFATPDRAVERAPTPPRQAPVAQPAVQTNADPSAQQAPMQIGPPAGWSPQAKARFDALDPTIKEAIAKREDEVARGFAKVADLRPLQPYVEQAKAAGKDLAVALDVYTQVDRRFARDPIDGLMAIMENTGLDPRIVVQEWGRRLGILAQDGTVSAQAPAQAAGNEQLAPIVQAVQSLLADRQETIVRNVNETVDQFWKDPANKYAENVAELMADLITQAREKGKSLPLKAAYEQACWLHPEVRDILIQERASARTASPGVARAASQARAAAKATVGAPVNGTPPASHSGVPDNLSLRDTIAAAVAMQRTAGGRV